MNKVKLLACLSIVLLFKSSLFLTQVTFDNINHFRKENLGSFLDKNNQISGFYILNSLSGDFDANSVFQLQLLDTNLSSKATVDFKLARNTSLIDITSNGENVLLFFVNGDGYELFTYNLKGEKLASKTIPKSEINSKEHKYFIRNAREDINFDVLEPNGEDSFIITSYLKSKKKYLFQLIAYDNMLNEIWRYNTPNPQKDVENVEINYIDNELLILTVSQKYFIDAQKLQQSMVCLNPKNGNLKYSLNLVNRKYGNKSITNVFREDERIFVLGDYYLPGDEIQYDESDGFYIREIDQQGNIIFTKEMSWKDNNARLAQKENVKTSKFDKYGIYSHDLVFLDSGKVYLIGEQYRKRISISGVLINEAVGFGAASYREVEVGDLILFEFDSKFKLEDINKIEKKNFIILMLYGDGNYSIEYLANRYKKAGQFGLKHISISNNKKGFSIVYTDQKKYKSLKVDMESIQRTDLNLKEADYFDKSFIIKAHNSKSLIVEHSKKEKLLKLELRDL